MTVTLIVYVVASPAVALLVGAVIRLADARAPHAKTPELERAA